MEKSVQSPPFELIDIVVRAGAGAGKTTELTHRVLKLAENYYSQHQRYPHFVVTTFTRKATQELKERLLKEAMKKSDQGLVDFVKRPSHLHISTIHGVLSLFLARHGSVVGLSPRITVISESHEKGQLKKKIRELCQKDSQFNQDFQVLLEMGEFPEILSAFSQYFRLHLQFGEIPFYSNADFEKIIQKKSQDLQKSLANFVEHLQAADLPEAWQELLGYCQTALAEYKKAESPRDFWLRFSDGLPGPRKTKAISDEVIEARDQFKNSLEFFESWRATSDFCQAHSNICEKFQNCANKIAQELLAIKLVGGEITMQDLETLSLSVIRQRPDAAENFSKQWDYWLVDEYQDTSPAQVELLKALSGSSKSFVVGDPQQSIYLFRGARSEVFGQREKAVHSAKGILFSKLVNYRSEPELLEFFNYLFTGLSSQFRKMTPKASPSQNQARPVAEIIQAIAPEDHEQVPEFEAVLARCQELVAEGIPLEKICVLGRSNQDLEDLAWLAQTYGIPVQVHASGQFFERREVVDALSLLKFLCNPHDNKNLLQILRSPVFRIPDQTLYEWCQEAGNSYWQSFLKSGNDVIKKLQSILLQAQGAGVGQTWRDLLVLEGYFKFAHLLDATGRREANLWKLIYMVRSEERRPGFSYLEFLKTLDVKSLSTEQIEEADAIPVFEPQKVHLMTVHASKGLQFAHVILPKMGKMAPAPKTEFFLFDETTGQWTLSLVEAEEGKKVCSLSGLALMETMKLRQKEEEDRVLYVALTRAEKGVTLIWGENPKTDSWAQRLPLKTQEGIHQEAHFSYRVRRGHFQPQALQTVEAPALAEILAYRPAVAIEMKTFSVTEILDQKQRVESRGEKSEMSDVQKAVTGVDVHRLFENLKYKWMRDPGFQWQELMSELSEQHQKALQYVAQDQNGRWLEVIRQGEVEFGLAVKLEEKLIQGQIDLWGTDSQGHVWIVDYKTGSPKYQDKAFHQLHIYSWALQRMKKIQSLQTVKLAVIYPFAEMTIIREAPSISEIERELLSLRD